MSDEEKETEETLSDPKLVDPLEKSIIESQIGDTISLEHAIEEAKAMEKARDAKTSDVYAKQDYIGGGVYTEFDGHGITLKAIVRLDPDDTVYLEPGVLEALIRFARRMGMKIKI